MGVDCLVVVVWFSVAVRRSFWVGVCFGVGVLGGWGWWRGNVRSGCVFGLCWCWWWLVLVGYWVVW